MRKHEVQDKLVVVAQPRRARFCRSGELEATKLASKPTKVVKIIKRKAS